MARGYKLSFGVVTSLLCTFSSVGRIFVSITVIYNNGLLIDKVSNGNSSYVSNVDNAIRNVSRDIPISNVSNVVNVSKVSCVDNVSNIDSTNVSAGNVGAGCSDSGVPLFGPANGVASDSPPHRGTRRWCLPPGHVSIQRRSLSWKSHRLQSA